MRNAYEPAADIVREDAPDGPEDLDGFNPYGSGPVPLRLRTPLKPDAADTDNE